MGKAIISYSKWKQGDKYLYEIREGPNPLKGKILFSGRDLPTMKEASKRMNAQIRKIAKSTI